MYNAVTDFIRRNNKIAIYYKDTTVSYDELYTNVCRYANAIKLQFNIGDKILINMSDRPEYIYMFWGAVKSGIVPVLVNTMLTKKEYDSIHNTSNPVYEFNDTNIGKFDSEATDLTDFAAATTTKDDICVIMYSSGTTGYLKEISHKHKDIAVTCKNYAANILNISDDDILYSAAKLFFAYGFGNSMSFPFYFGASTVLISETSSAKIVLDTIEKYRPTIYFGVPSIYAQQIKSIKANSYDTSSLKLCVSAGEPLPGKLLDEWMQLTNTIILDGIGSTEALHIFISNTKDMFEHNCSGQIVPGYTAKILDPITNMLTVDGDIGDLYIFGDSISTIGIDWLKTGDMYIKRGEKYYYQGRSNDMLKVGGVWVSPAEIEAKIIEHDGVLEAGVVIGTNLSGLLKPKAFVVLTDPNNATIATKNSIKRKCMSELPANHYPYWVDFVTTLPKTATGKIRRHILRTYDVFSPPNLND